MNRKEFDLMLFYCWQLCIKTAGQLAEWKAQHKATNNTELLQALTKAYNGKEWEEVNGLTD